MYNIRQKTTKIEQKRELRYDSNEFTEFLSEEDQIVYTDSAYVGKEIPDHVENRVCEKGYRGKPLTDEQKIGLTNLVYNICRYTMRLPYDSEIIYIAVTGGK